MPRASKRLVPDERPQEAEAAGRRASKRRATQPKPEPENERPQEAEAAASRRVGKRRAAPEPEPEPIAVDDSDDDVVVMEPTIAAERLQDAEAAAVAAERPQEASASASSSRRAGKQRAAPEPEPTAVDDSDDDVVVVEAGAAASAAARLRDVEPTEAAGDDDEVQITGRSGDLALADFPHAREFCCNKPFVPGKWAESCSNCYCYVCDAPAAECPEWESGDAHCKATHESAAWQAKRVSWRVHGGKPHAAGAAGSSAAAPEDVSAAAATRSPPVTRWSCDEVLGKVQQVYPREESEPSGFTSGLTLRPYQRQSLAFMLDVERSLDAETEGQRGRLRHAKQYAPSRRWHGKQPVTWEAVEGAATSPARGGWLCDEVGMGKTAVVAALVLANPARDVKPVSDADFKRLLTQDGRPHRFPCTVIVVNNTLVQQWCDELKKFAPSLRVVKYYGDGKKKELGLQQLREVDVLLTTPHMQMPPYLQAHMLAHRLVVDEAHLLAEGAGNTTASKLGYISAYQASSVWLVTGTPFTSSLDQLTTQAQLLGQWETGLKLQETRPHSYDPNPQQPQPSDVYGYRYKETMPNEMVVERLRKLMIRHTKAQRVGGEAALALPDADCSTVWLDMSADERLMYNLHRCVQPAIPDMHSDYLAQCVAQLDACSHKYSADIVCGKHASFATAHAERLGLKSKHAYEIQIQSHERLQRVLGEGVVRKVESRDVLGRVKVSYKYTEGHVPGEKLHSWQKEPTEPKAKREIYDVGDGDETSIHFPRPPPSLDSPPPQGGFTAATAAFLRTHTKVHVPAPKLTAKERRRVEMGVSPEPPTTVESWQSHEQMTKFRALTTDLASLRATEPHFRVIVFTRHSFVQERLVRLIEGEARQGGSLAPGADGSKVAVFEFTQKTAPQQRHRLISNFQAAGGGARVFIVTYAVAAVGITLTAANRVFLMEPCIDPAQEIQAAGRIHRLGQEKDCFIKRFCFRDSIEEAVVELHEKVKAKEIGVVDGKLDETATQKALSAFMAGKTTHDHSGATRERSAFQEGNTGFGHTLHEDVHGDSVPDHYNSQYSDVVDLGQTKSRKTLYKENIERYRRENWYKLTCQQAACVFCGRYDDVPGSFHWSGAGVFGYLEGDTRDPPKKQSPHAVGGSSGAGRFVGIPRPPDGWRDLPLERTDNGGELPPAPPSAQA